MCIVCTDHQLSGSTSLAMARAWGLVALFLGSLVAGAQALYAASSPVIQLTPDNFEAKIKGRGGIWIVE